VIGDELQNFISVSGFEIESKSTGIRVGGKCRWRDSRNVGLGRYAIYMWD